MGRSAWTLKCGFVRPTTWECRMKPEALKNANNNVSTIHRSAGMIPKERRPNPAVPLETLFIARKRLLIGRAADCDICLPHPTISRRHALLPAHMDYNDNPWLSRGALTLQSLHLLGLTARFLKITMWSRREAYFFQQLPVKRFILDNDLAHVEFLFDLGASGTAHSQKARRVAKQTANCVC